MIRIVTIIFSVVFILSNSTGSDLRSGFQRTGSDSQKEQVEIARKFLKEHYREDLLKGFIFEQSKKFLVATADLNGDNKPETFIALTGPTFCGSGGCTFHLLASSGKLINTFTVSDYPVMVSDNVTKGWRDLVIYSNRKYRSVKYGKSKYPSNPSLEPEADIKNIKSMKKLFDLSAKGVQWQVF